MRNEEERQEKKRERCVQKERYWLLNMNDLPCEFVFKVSRVMTPIKRLRDALQYEGGGDDRLH